MGEGAVLQILRLRLLALNVVSFRRLSAISALKTERPDLVLLIPDLLTLIALKYASNLKQFKYGGSR